MSHGYSLEDMRWYNKVKRPLVKRATEEAAGIFRCHFCHKLATTDADWLDPETGQMKTVPYCGRC
jgi:hypothetical protein